MEVKVHWWNSHPDFCKSPGMWDQHFLEKDLLRDFEIVERDQFTEGVVVIPGRHHNTVEDALEIAAWLNTKGPTITIITSDEEASFHDELLPTGDNRRLWVMTPSIEKNYPKGTRFFGSMTTPGLDNSFVKETPELNFAFMGQVTHDARQKMADALRHRTDGELLETPGFTQGESPERYSEILGDAKIAPCPPGPVCPDSFRLYEALEMGCLPILNKQDSKYWMKLYGKLPPFLYTDGWENVGAVIDKGLHNWLKRANKATAWWKREKFFMRERLISDLNDMGAITPTPLMTVLISCSPIHSHPSDEVLAETIASIRERINAPIFLMFDGVRKEQQKFTEVYQEHIRKILLRYKDDPKIVPFIMDSHNHQAAMTRRTIEVVRTPLILFVEQDTPLIGDIPWGIAEPLLTDQLDMIRLYHEAEIQKNHEYLMLDHGEGPLKNFTRTCQWSQRPHIARTDWYRNLLRTYFSLNSRTMIEDEMYSVATSAWNDKGMEGWGKFRIAIYNPGGDIKRSTHLDGRGSEPKFSMKLAYDGERPEFAPFARVL